MTREVNMSTNQGANKGTYLNSETLALVELAANKAGISVSAWIKKAILAYLTK